MTNETIPYVTRNLRHLLAAPNLTETQRTIITRTLATLSEEFPEHKAYPTERYFVTFDDNELLEIYELFPAPTSVTNEGGR